MDLGYGDASEIVVHTFGWLPGTPDDLMLACGVAIGFEDTEPPINRVHSARASIDEFATFID